ncbi:DUF5994 family protein [Sciscionella marina]|uniref:DUF5994 family protein n=1 Tax=Sciscionella marina TaxID=508770 RepID=UPI003B82D2E5
MKDQKIPGQRENRQRARLCLRPFGSAHGQLGGGWWPRSTDLVTELETLAAAIRSRFGSPGQVHYHASMWAPVPPQADVDGQNVRLVDVRSLDSHTVVLLGASARRLRLLVVPPTVHRGTAHAVLRASAVANHTTSAEDILASNGVLDSDSGEALTAGRHSVNGMPGTGHR